MLYTTHKNNPAQNQQKKKPISCMYFSFLFISHINMYIDEILDSYTTLLYVHVHNFSEILYL